MYRQPKLFCYKRLGLEDSKCYPFRVRKIFGLVVSLLMIVGSPVALGDDAPINSKVLSLKQLPTFSVSGQITTGRYSQGVAFRKNTAYVTNSNDGTISIFDLKKNTSTQYLIGGNPWTIRIIGNLAYVADIGANRISILNLNTLKIVGTLAVVRPYNFIIENGKIYVAGGQQNEGGVDNKLSIFDVISGNLIAEVPVGGNPTSVTVSDNYAYVANSASNYVSIVDLTTYTVVESMFVGLSPISVASLNGKLYVTLPVDNQLRVFDLASRQVVSGISVGSAPFGVSLYRNFAFVSNALSDDLSIINLTTNSEVSRIPVGDYPNYTVFQDDSAFALSSGNGSNFGSLTIIDFNRKAKD